MMGLFGGEKKPSNRGVSLIVNQIEKQAGRRRIPKILAVVAIVLILLTAGFALTRAAEDVDRQDVPRRDETVPESESLSDYKLKYVLAWDGINEGGGYGMQVTVKERSQDLQLIKLAGADKGPGADLYIGVAANSCVESGVTNQQYEFPASFTVYFPNGKQTPTRNLPYCLGDDERTQITYTAWTGEQGFGAYEVRGTILDGEVVACGFFGKCWEYEEHAFAYKFDVKKEGRFW